MNCAELDELLTDKVLAELTEAERAAVAAHVDECTACRERHGLDAQSQELHDAIKPLGAEPDLTSTVMARLTLADTKSPGAGPEDDPAVPEMLGGFEIIGLLGRGGMGNVFKARQVSMDRLVALKILPLRLARNEEFIERLTREARSAAKLCHPNIVHAYDVGSADGHYYFAMEYVDGEGLDAVVRREGPLGSERARQVMMQVARALAAAHEAGIIHRDIKPSNIMLDAKGQVRVTDFGLAERAGAVGAAHGTALGTPAYVAPEMVAGKPVDGRSDLYSLGATFFHMLAGRPPFEGRSFSQIVMKQVNDERPALADVAPHVDPRLCRVIDRLLCKDPNERYPSAKALLGKLEALGALDPTDAVQAQVRAMIHDSPTRPLGAQLPAEELPVPWWASRRRLTALAACAAVLCLAVGLVAFWPGGTPEAARAPGSHVTMAQQQETAREQNAEAVFLRARHAATREQWALVQKDIARLKNEYAATKFVEHYRAAIDDLGRRAELELQPRVVTPIPGHVPDAAKVERIALVRPEPAGEWVELFDGKTLAGWQVVKQGAFAHHGDVRAADGRIVLEEGGPLTGIACTGEFPRIDYEVTLEAMRAAGNHDFASMTFPFGDAYCCYQVSGSEDASLVGLSNVDGRRVEDPENVTRKDVPFKNRQWYRLRLRVTEPRIEAWIDDEKVTDFATAGHTLTHHDAVPPLAPFGIHSWGTTAAVRNVRMRRVKPGAAPPGLVNGLVAAFYVGQSFERFVAATHVDRIFFNWAHGGPAPNVPVDGFSARFVGWLQVPEPADYTFRFWRDDGARLYLDGKLVINQWGEGDPDPPGSTLWLDRGLHPIWVEYMEMGGTAAVGLHWSRGEPESVVPPDAFRCDPTLLERAARAPGEDPFAGLRPDMQKPGGHAPEPFGPPGRWVSLFDGKTLNGWKVMREGEFAQRGQVRADAGRILLGAGGPCTGIAWTGDFPTIDYEIRLEAMRTSGKHDFASMTFPFGDVRCLFQVSGSLEASMVGLLNVDAQRVKDPKSVVRTEVPFDNNRWYNIRLVVGRERIEAWIDDRKVTDLAAPGHALTHYNGLVGLTPFGLCTWGTSSALRDIRVRRLHAGRPDVFVAQAHRGGPVATALVTVPARSQWFDSGLDVELGGAYRFTASGRWGASPEHTGGPEGQPQGRAPGKFPVPGAPMYALIGRVGAEGKPFVVGAKHEMAAAAAGRLFLTINDPGVDDNRGSVAVMVKGPLVAAPAVAGESIDKGALVVSARAGWRDSGLHVTRGAHYRLTAKGHWGTSLVHTGGPEGGPQAEPADKLELPGAPPYGLIARVGLDGEPFVVARSAGRVAKQWGRLFLRMNDADLNENWGSIRVDVDGPLIADWRARVLSRFTRELPRLSVSAANDFTPTAVDVRLGDVLLIQAEGQWNPGERACDADGLDAVMAEHRRGMLVGRIGEGGEPIRIGALHVLEAQAEGTLHLAMNDDERGDNTGSVQVTVRAFERPGPPKLPEEPGVWASLFDGRSLHGWRAVSGAGFAGRRRVLVEPGRIVLQRPPERAALAWTGEFPSCDYELSLEVMREDGVELCELLFPVGSERCAWNIAGWGGTGTGLSMVDGVPGDLNDTNGKMACRDRQWYRLRLRVTAAKIEGWRDGEKYIDLSRAGRRFTQPDWLPIPEPFALDTWRTALAIRNVRVQRLESRPEEPPADGAEIEAAAVAVSAREGWQDTGLYLTKGERYTISAAGRWGANAQLSCGPEGQRREESRPYPLFGERVLDLVGRLGPQGWPFSVGGRLELAAAQSGRLFLRMNDDETANNWGSLRADVRGPMLADKNAPLLSRFPATVAKVQVRPGGGWVSSGIDLRRGDRVLLSAKGSWRQGAGQPPIDPNGLNRSFKHVRAGALVGRVGPHGARFVVGELHLLEAAEDGELYLAVNDVARARVIRNIELMGREPGAPRGRIGGRTVPGGPIVVPAGEPAALNLIERALRRLREARRHEQAPKALQEAAAAAGAAAPPAPPQPARRAEQAVEPEGPAAQAAPVLWRRGGPLVAAPRLPRPTGALEVTVSASAAFGQRHKQPDGRPGPPFRLLTTLRGHRSWVICVGFSPDGKHLASGSRDFTARLWDTATWRAVRTLSGHRETIESVAFSPDGTRLISGSRDKSLGLWDVAAGRRLRTLLGHGDHVLSVACFPDGKRAASTGDDQTVRIWDLATGRWTSLLRGDAASWAVAVSPDGKLVAMASSRGWIRIWDAETGRIKQAFFAQMPNSWSLAFSPDGKRLASGSDAPVIKVWDVATGKCLKTLETDGMIRGLAFSPDGKWIAAGGWYRVVRVWDAATYEHVRTLEDHTSEVRGLAFSPDGKRLATASFDTTIKIWTLDPGDQPAPRAALEVRHVAGLTAHASAVLSLAVSPDGNWVATGGKDKTVKVAHLWQRLFPRTLAGHTNEVGAVAFSPDGKQIASGSHDKSIRLWDLVTGRCLKTLEGHQRGVTSVAFFPDGKRLASSSTDGTFRIWDLAAGTCARTGQADPAVASVAVSPDGKQLATAGGLGRAKVWDVATGRRQHDLVCSSLACWSVAFSPDGNRLASVGQATTVKLWDLATGKRLKALEAGALLRCAALSPDGKWLAAAGPRGALRVWNSHTFEALKAPKADAVDYSAVVFLPDSKRLVTAGADGTVKVWALLPPGAALPKPDRPKAPPPGHAVPDRAEPVEPRGGAVPAAPPRVEPRPR